MTVSGIQVLQLLVLVFVLSAARCEAGFLRPINSEVGLSPGSIVVADFNGDGNQDMAVVNFYGGSLSVMLGNGDGTFQSSTLYQTGGRPYSLATEDFNGDGKLDLAVANLVDATVSVLLNRGDGTFLPRTDYLVQGAYSVATGDFNEDGNPDLAVANGLDSGSIDVLLGEGDGTFGNPVGYSTGSFSMPEFVAIADLNHDSHVDVVAGNLLNNRVAVLMGNGDGTFQDHADYVTTGLPVTVAISDLNGDGNLDLVVAGRSVKCVSVLMGNGDGTFRPRTDYPTTGLPFFATLGDFNLDGALDLVVNGDRPGKLAILRGNGDGSFGSAVEYAIGGGTGSNRTAVGDFNGDGVADVAVSDSKRTVGVMLNSGVKGESVKPEQIMGIPK